MNFEQATFLIGKIILGGYFVFSGLNHFMRTRDMAKWVEQKGIPKPEIMVYLSGIVLILGGLGIIAGAYPVISIGILSAFLIVTNITMHNYWSLEEGRQEQMNHFLKNTALIGALLMLLGADWTIYGLGITLSII